MRIPVYSNWNSKKQKKILHIYVVRRYTYLYLMFNVPICNEDRANECSQQVLHLNTIINRYKWTFSKKKELCQSSKRFSNTKIPSDKVPPYQRFELYSFKEHVCHWALQRTYQRIHRLIILWWVILTSRYHWKFVIIVSTGR